MQTRTLVTADEFLTMTSDTAKELVRGEVVDMGNPSALHGFVCMNVGAILREWARRNRAGYVFGNDSGVVTERDPDTVRGPDCQYISVQKLPQGVPAKGYPNVPPDLVVEVVSESDRWADVVRKAEEYLDAGISEVWVVEPRNEFVDVYRADHRRPVRYSADDELMSDRVLPGFRCRVADFFSAS
ncbi:MAG: Uma2 family endonuclease [Planctomycetaceae bacterium]